MEPEFEHGVLVDTRRGRGRRHRGPPRDWPIWAAGAPALALTNHGAGRRGVLLGGEPFDEEIVMWWNFVGRTHDEIVAYRDQWQAESPDSARCPAIRVGDDEFQHHRYRPPGSNRGGH